ncbi:MAG: outer membrane beta-barrel protein [Candidatus Binatia bacterium]
MKRFWSTLGAVVLFFGCATWSNATTDFNRLGPYVGIGAAAGLSDFTEESRGFGDSAGFNLLGGYRWHEYFALEGMYEYMDNFGRSDRVSGLERKVHTDIRTHNFSLMGKVIFPFFGPVQPFMKGGIGFLHADVDRKVKSLGRAREMPVGSNIELSGRLDGGIDFILTPHLALTFDAGYIMPTDSLFHLNYVSLGAGAQYRF